MHPGLKQLYRRLQELRDAAGYSQAEVEERLVLGNGWVEQFETGLTEPSLGTLVALLDVYKSDLPSFVEELDLGEAGVVLDRHLSATKDGINLVLHFPMGIHQAEVRIPEGSVEQFNEVTRALRDGLATGTKQDAIIACFLKAAQVWPSANPSDLWYFLVSHAYQDGYNHPAASAGTDWAQSWKRAAGWALEEIFVAHYNPYLSSRELRLEMPRSDRKQALLKTMGVNDAQGAEKADVIVVGTRSNGEEEPLGVAHVKASFAERRTDDVPLSERLMSRGYISCLLTMDCKATPSSTPCNRGELGPTQGGGRAVSSKRTDIERDMKFDACFSYNSNTIPTPDSQGAPARIYVGDFKDPDDAFSRHLLRKWRDWQGLH